MLDNDWVKTEVANARKCHLVVTEAVEINISELLKGPFLERQLSTAELKEISLSLIQAMTPIPPETEGK